MTKRTLTVEREESLAVCDVCGRDADAYDAPEQFDTYWPADPDRREEIDGQLHFHERCLADVEGMSMPRDQYDGFRFWGGGQYHSQDIRAVFVAVDGRRVALATAIAIAGAFVVGAAGTVTASVGWGFLSLISATAAILFLVVSYRRAANMGDEVRERLKR